jgi:ubiquinone/menaquinone biosynthesis C-methylase UbiE
MAAPRDEYILDVNARYHDVAAGDYDRKWGVSFEEPGRREVVSKLAKALGETPRFGRSLEIGAGTGYFALNLVRSGAVAEAVATDISRGMLDELEHSARELGLDVETARCDASALPYADDSFDFLFGHAVLHHLPDLDAAFREFRRVLRPGGRVAFCGEPSRHGDRLAALPKRAALAVSPLWRRAVGAGPRLDPESPEEVRVHGLEHVVDVHAFTPGELQGFARRAGFEGVRVRGEELVAGWFGWANRTLESTAESRQIPGLWFQYAYRGYRALKAVDTGVLESRLPPAIFYNLLLSGRAPHDASGSVARPRPRAAERTPAARRHAVATVERPPA